MELNIVNHWCADSGEVSTLLSLSHIFTFSFMFNFMHFNFTQTNRSIPFFIKLTLILANLITKPLQSLRFDTFYIAISYEICPIASGNL
jgi:hypothetical protein